ncbi:DUF6348 family protein [Anatilimnocola floriformis]|uniref:DUF6348 family protein n=1 Tax=Anatilimnocola floriformis TaxID=2948575 RepID=UPI0020C3A960|nr:DUF6348 family protein [Anatilimnocola floriformis]
MSEAEAEHLLELIEDGIAEHGGDLGGWTRRDGDTLQLFDGRVTLRASITENEAGSNAQPGFVHAHVLTTLHEHDDEVLDACLFGLGNNRDEGLQQAAVIWMTSVAGPIRSFLDNRPVCMSCQAGVMGGDQSQGYSEGDYGLPGLRAFVGPAIVRGFDDSCFMAALNDHKPWFRYAAESAAPRHVHLVKVIILHEPGQGWRREMEVDGHDVSYSDSNWPAGIAPPDVGYITRFAVFEFPRNSREIARRKELERTILHFAANYGKYDQVDEMIVALEQAGFDPDLLHEVESFSTIAFGRALFGPLGAAYPATVIRARRDGRVETDVPLMTIPAYTRARALIPQIGSAMPLEDFQALALYNAESHALAQVLEKEGDQVDLSRLQLFPLIIPDRETGQQTMDAAWEVLNKMIEESRAARKPKKPWWKFW